VRRVIATAMHVVAETGEIRWQTRRALRFAMHARLPLVSRGTGIAGFFC